MADIAELTKLAISFRDEREWKRFHTPKNMMLGLFVEAAELAEHVQYFDGEELDAYIRRYRQEIGEEMADVLYWLLLMSHELKIDLNQAFKDKMKKNALKYPAPKNGELVGKFAAKLKTAKEITGL